MAVRTAHIELHLAVLLFGVAGLFGKLISASAITIVAGRSAFAAMAIFLAVKFYRERFSVHSSKSFMLMLVSGLVLALHWVTFFHAIQTSTVAIGLIGFSTFPIFVTFLEPLLSRQRVRSIDLVSALMVTIGLIVVAPSFALSDSGTLGLLWAVVSGALFALLALINRHLVGSNPFIIVAFYQHSIAALCLLPLVMMFEGPPDTSDIWLLLLLGVVCTAVPQTLFIKSLAVVKAQLAAVVAALEPVYGIVFAALLIAEVPALSTLFGAAIVFGSVLLAMKAHADSDQAN